MSIRTEIEGRKQDGSLAWLQPKKAQTPNRRIILLAASLHEAVTSVEHASAYRMGRLRADLDHFTGGGMVSIGRGIHKTCYLKQLDPTEDEIWEIRSRDPKPSLRLFGAFAEPDVFVGLRLMERTELGGPSSDAWKIAIRGCKADWRKLFFTYPRHSGETVNDYVSENAFSDADFD